LNLVALFNWANCMSPTQVVSPLCSLLYIHVHRNPTISVARHNIAWIVLVMWQNATILRSCVTLCKKVVIVCHSLCIVRWWWVLWQKECSVTTPTS
jgi:hypothetical protein